MVYIAKCAWCGKYLGTREDEKEEDLGRRVLVSHGICPDCRRSCMEEGRRLFRPGAAAVGLTAGNGNNWRF